MSDALEQKRKLLNIHRRRLHELEVKAAQYGLACPVEIKIEIEDIKKTIAGLEAKPPQTSPHKHTVLRFGMSTHRPRHKQRKVLQMKYRRSRSPCQTRMNFGIG